MSFYNRYYVQSRLIKMAIPPFPSVDRRLSRVKPARLHVTVVHAWHVHACQTYKQLSVGLVATRGEEKLEKALRNWAESLLPPGRGVNVWPCSMQRACARAEEVGKSFGACRNSLWGQFSCLLLPKLRWYYGAWKFTTTRNSCWLKRNLLALGGKRRFVNFVNSFCNWNLSFSLFFVFVRTILYGDLQILKKNLIKWEKEFLYL